MNQLIRILIADDHQIFLDGLRAILKNEPRIQVVAEAVSGDEVMRMMLIEPIDIVVLDYEMQGKNGYEAAMEIRMLYPHVKILMLTMHEKGEFIDKLMTVPVDGYILKFKGSEQLVNAIYALESGKQFFGQEITEEWFRYRRDKQKTDDVRLTPREEDVLRLIANECTTPQIAEKLFIAQSTVETHRRNLIGKLGVKSTLGLVKWAVEHGIK